MIWEQFKLKLNNAYLVAEKYGLQNNDLDMFMTLLIKRIKYDFQK